ncbi:MAG: pilin, partial [Patescibacteria group bacterium]
IRYGLSLVGTVFLAYTVYAGFILIISRGEEEKITKAKDTLRRSTIGIIVILSAYGLTTFITRQLTHLTKEPEGRPDGYVDVNVSWPDPNISNPRNRTRDPLE